MCGKFQRVDAQPTDRVTIQRGGKSRVLGAEQTRHAFKE
jgi:hypothetical protein